MKLAKKIFPLNRSLTGKGTLATLKYFKKINNKIIIKNVKSGKKIFDWKVPEEWNVNHAYFQDEKKRKYCNFKKTISILLVTLLKKRFNHLQSIIKKIYFNKDKPNSIPYVTSYYKKDWGFCMSLNDFKKLKKSKIFCEYKY